MAASKTAAAGSVVADICLYGSRYSGAGWLAATADGSIRLGTGEPDADRSFTDAVFQAVECLRVLAGIQTGQARIFAPGGQTMALVDLGGLVPYYGDLQWQAAPVYVLDVETLLALKEDLAAAVVADEAFYAGGL